MKTNTKDLTIGYKGYNSDFTCTPHEISYQYAENTIHELPKGEKLECCETGFHYCINPLDVLGFYSLIGVYGELNVFTKVEALGEIDTDDDCIKCATNKIKIGDKLSLEEYVDECVKYMKENYENGDDCASQLAIEKDYSQIATNENYSRLAISGSFSQVATNGHSRRIAMSGYNSKVAVNGNYSQIAMSGYSSQIAISGDISRVATSGRYSHIAVSGECSKVATSGDCSQVATSGEYSQVVASGKGSHITTSGDNSWATISGERSRVAVNGDNSSVNIQGSQSSGVNMGISGIIKGVLGTWITLAEYDEDGKCICVKSAMIDGEELKENVWYTLKNGEFVEC